MRAPTADLLFLVLPSILAGCGAGPASEPPPTTTASGGTRTDESRAAPTCMPPGLESAHEVEIVRLPTGCHFGGAGPISAPTVLADDAAVAAAITCDGEAPTITLGEDELRVVSFTMSPAFGGLGLYDDGTAVTFVMRDRPPCPDDPQPMPMPSSALAFRLPRGASRTFQQLACSLPRSCP